ncbi:MAG: tetratricopeptide repeat protein [Lachnospiraceae bacterium]|jgi:tetratricopeptide (TPR) repeat protein|nr:tetratricopeptide repeat protein [Lachnospiraceae bacterium]
MKPRIGKYVIMILISLLLLAFGIFLTIRYFINHNYVTAYNNGDYNATGEDILKTMNFPEGYVPYYNLGNAAYQKGEYILAAENFSQALKYYPREGEDCKIRINLALSLCYTIDFEKLDNESKIESALVTLYQARNTLMQNGCANDEGTGHNKDAQQLKEDIDKMIEKLTKSNPPPQQNPDQNNNGDGGGGNGNSQGNKNKENELKNNKDKAQQDRANKQGQSGGGGSQGGDGGQGGGGSTITRPW